MTHTPLREGKAIELARTIFDAHFKDKYVFFDPGFFVAPTGFGVAVGDGKATAGYGIARRLSPTVELLREVEEWNRRNLFGHFWLSEGSEDTEASWSLIFGFKFTFDFDSAESFFHRINILAQSHEAVGYLLERVEPFGAKQYWNSSEEQLQGAALVLISKLG